jgi:CRISPR-associated endonuclease Csn1
LEIFETDTLTYEQEQIAENIIYYSTIYGDSKKFLEERIRELYGEVLNEKQIKRILGLKFKDWGRFSRELLELVGVEISTGEQCSIISKMWNDNYNFMELMTKDKFSYAFEIEERVNKIEKTLSTIEYEDLDELYISAPVKRMVWQTILVLKELVETIGYPPERIFVEMARNDEEKNVRKESRKNKLLALYANCRKEERNWKKEIEGRDEAAYRSKKLYL